MGMVVTRVIVHDSSEKADNCQTVDGPASDRSEGFFVLMEQDIERAATGIAVDAYLDPVSFDAAGLIVSKQIMESGYVPVALRNWTAAVVAGSIRRPSVKGKITGATVARDKMIYALISDLVTSLDLKPTSSNRDHGQSACHAVAEALALLGLEPRSYQAIVKIWENRGTLKTFSTTED